MSHSNPPHPSRGDAAPSDFAPSAAPSEFGPSDFGRPAPPTPDSRIEREIERSERASAALMATRAMARAAFTDSQLAAEEAAQPEHADADFGDIDSSSWERTEYVAFDPTPQDEVPRSLVGGSFNPGIASQHGRQFPSASISMNAIRTRSGAQGRFAQESRHAPRGDSVFAAPARTETLDSSSQYEKPAVVPVLAPAAARPPVPTRTGGRARASEPAKFLLAAALGAVVVLAGGALAWNAGLLSRRSPDDAALVTPAVAAQAEAARAQAVPQDIPAAPAPAATPERSSADVDAALAAAARAAAVPTASVRAAAPPRVAAPASSAVAPAASPVLRAGPQGKESVADAIANAQARADRFLAGSSAGSAPAGSATPEAKPEQ